MKIALINDLHYGVRGDSQIFLDHFEDFFSKIFFPYLDKHNIKNIICLGDVTDRRKFINYVTANALHKDFIKPIIDRKIQLTGLVGNHDCYYRNNNRINSLLQLYRNDCNNIKFYDNLPVELDFDNRKILLVPWISNENYDQSLKILKETDTSVIFGHFDIKGFEMFRGMKSTEGFNSSLFDKFSLVCSGHYHHKSTVGNINYLGSPYQMTWSDYGDKRGFHIFDTETLSLTFIENPVQIFNKIYYDEDLSSINELLEVDYSYIKNSYVKLIVNNKKNSYSFDLFINKLQENNPVDLQIIEDDIYFNLEETELLDESEDTLTILNKYIQSLDNEKVNKDKLNNIVQSLYMEAINL